MKMIAMFAIRLQRRKRILHCEPFPVSCDKEILSMLQLTRIERHFYFIRTILQEHEAHVVEN